MEKKVNVSIGQAEVILMTHLTDRDGYAKVYLEPNNRYSEGGGTVTMSFPDYDLIGQHFFSHVSSGTLKGFVAQCDAEYLISKLFKDLEPTMTVQDSRDFFQWVRREGLDELKNARHSGCVTKQELRDLYDDIGGRDFEGIVHFVEGMSRDSFKTMCKIYGDDWYFARDIKKPNYRYQWVVSAMKVILLKLKEMDRAIQAQE